MIVKFPTLAEGVNRDTMAEELPIGQWSNCSNVMFRNGSLMRARVAELFLHPPAFIDASDTIEAAGHLMREIGSNALFVRDGERIVTVLARGEIVERQLDLLEVERHGVFAGALNV